MADNVAVTPGTGAAIATDDVAGVQFQKVKLDGGGDGLSVPVVAGQQTMAASLPVVLASNQSALVVDGSGSTQPVSAASLPLPAGAATESTLQGMNNDVATMRSIMTPTEDAAAAANPQGTHLVARRRDALSVETTTDGDITALNSTGKGELYVKQTDAIDLAAGTNNIGDVDVLSLPAIPAGTNNIGDVDILSIAAGDNNIGNVDIVTQPARAATTDNIGAKLATDAIMNGVTALTPKFAIIDAAASGDNTLLAAVSSKKIRVLALFLVSAGTVTVRFESGAGGTALSGQMNLVANSGFTLPFNPVGWFETAATTLLNLELSGTVSVDGSFVYVEV